MEVETFDDDFLAAEDAFVDMAAIIKNLDLVIACDTGIAHLAGALGVPTWVALKKIPDWRWMLDREDSPWYPSNLKLFRQLNDGEWSSVFQQMEREIRRKI
jgi:ADP-heptose:LPS heptosyltransferase